jgi:pyruvate formate-lyase/glycerol dehydratase family glycyl radical enzyme
MSERTNQLKERVVFKDSIVNKVGTEGCIIAEMARGSRLSLERAKLVTESYKNTEGEPMVLRRAKSLAHVLENMAIYINEGELIVGNYSPSSRDIPFHPEISYRHLSMALEPSTGDQSYRKVLDEKDREDYKELVSYWKGKTLYDRGMAVLPRRLLDYTRYNGVAWSPVLETYNALESTNIRGVLDIGLNGMIKKIEARLDEIERDEAIPAGEYVEQRHNLEAMRIAAEAAIHFGRRFAAEARKLASIEKDERRKNELLNIAEVCDWVPANPARTLHEAIQSFLFCLTICTQIENPHGVGGGIRIDTLMDPFYQEDIRKERMTREEAQELVECLLIKISDHTHLFPPSTLQNTGGGISVNRDLTIGGVTPSGEDATNEFSFITLDAAKSVRLPEPTIAVRYHPGISSELISKAIDVVKTGVGYPAFYNDLAYISWFQAVGYTSEEARNYGIAACVGGVIQDGANCSTHHAHAGTINLSKCLELALYRGKDKDKYTGKQLGVETPDLRNATCVEEVMDAYLKQVGYVARKLAEIDNIRTTILEEYLPRPFASVLIKGCIEKGKHSLTWGHNGSEKIIFTGGTNVTNSLAAIKKFVFEEKLVTMEELIEACKTDFEGKEDLRQTLINKAPKYGNDDDYADAFAVEVNKRTNEMVMQSAKDRWGYPYYLDASIAGGYFAASTNCGAIPDGKKDSEPTADGSLSPSAGTDRKGPTAVLNSAAKIPYTFPHLLNQKFLPQFLEGENKQIFAQYLKTWCQLGIGHIQFNVVGKPELLDAQARPQKYPNLIVRVAGYSAYFVDLAKALQNDIIRRVEQEF